MTRAEMLTLIATAETAQMFESEFPQMAGFSFKWRRGLTVAEDRLVQEYLAARVVAIDALAKMMEGAELMMWEAPE